MDFGLYDKFSSIAAVQSETLNDYRRQSTPLWIPHFDFLSSVGCAEENEFHLSFNDYEKHGCT